MATTSMSKRTAPQDDRRVPSIRIGARSVMLQNPGVKRTNQLLIATVSTR